MTRLVVFLKIFSLLYINCLFHLLLPFGPFVDVYMTCSQWMIIIDLHCYLCLPKTAPLQSLSFVGWLSRICQVRAAQEAKETLANEELRCWVGGGTSGLVTWSIVGKWQNRVIQNRPMILSHSQLNYIQNPDVSLTGETSKSQSVLPVSMVHCQSVSTVKWLWLECELRWLVSTWLSCL